MILTPPEGVDWDEEEGKMQPIWNLETGFTYRIVQGKRPIGVIPAAKAAVAALSLDFGAVDIITKGTDVYVLEVNTAPGLCPITLNWYARQFANLLGIDPTTLTLEKQDGT